MAGQRQEDIRRKLAPRRREGAAAAPGVESRGREGAGGRRFEGRAQAGNLADGHAASSRGDA